MLYMLHLIKKIFLQLFIFSLACSFLLSSIPSFAAGTITKSAKDSASSSTTAVPQGGTIDYALKYTNTGTTIDNIQISDLLGANQTLVNGSLQVPTGFDKNYSIDGGTNYTTTEPGVGVNAIKSTANIGVGASNASTQSIPKPTASFNTAAGGGDGWRPIIYHSTDGLTNKLCTIYHHILDAKINCTDLTTGNVIAGYPKRLNTTQSILTPVLMGRTNIQIGSKVYIAVTEGSYGTPANNTSGIQCFDMATDTGCGYSVIGAAVSMNSTVSTNAANDRDYRVGALVEVNGKYFYSVFNKLYCADLPAATPCAGFTPYTFTPLTNDSIYFQTNLVVGNKLFISGGLSNTRGLFCVDLSTTTAPVTCAGSWPKTTTATAAGGDISEMVNASGTLIGVCNHLSGTYNNVTPTLTSGYCYDFAGATLTAPTGLKSQPAISTIRIGTRVYTHGDEPYTYCYDYSTNAPCAGFTDSGAGALQGVRRWGEANASGTGGVIAANVEAYSFEYDRGCLYGTGNAGYAWSFDPLTGNSPCSKVILKDTAKLGAAGSTPCDGSAFPTSTGWGKIQPLNNTYPAGWQSTTVTIYSDAAQTSIIPGFNTIAVPASGLDISTISSTTYPNLYLSYDYSSTIASNVTMVVTNLFASTPTYTVCFKAKVANTCFLPALINTATTKVTTIPVTGASVYTTASSNTTSLTSTSSATCYGAITGTIFTDPNADGIDQGDGTAFNNVSVELRDSTNNLVATVQTNSSGVYLFPNVVPGVGYTVTIPTLPSGGYVLSAPNQGGNTAINSDFVVATKKTGSLTVVANATVTDVDALLNIPNQPPVAVTDTYETPKNTAKTLTPLAADSDPDGGTLSITSINGTAIISGTVYTIPVTNGSVSVSTTGVVTFTPANNYTGTVTFPYIISDGQGGTATANEIITIVDAVDDLRNTPVNTPITYAPISNDIVPVGSNITKINGVTPVVGTPIPVPNGTATLLASGSITFQPNNGYTGTVVFPYSVTTPSGSIVSAVDTIVIVSSSDDVGETPINTPKTYFPMINDNVPTGSTITKINGVTPVVGTPITIPNATVTLNANGSVTVTPGTTFTGTLTFPYTVTTPLGTNVTSTDIIYVVGATDDVRDTLINTPITYSPMTNDSVPVGSTISNINGTPAVVGTPITVPHGSVVLNANGSVTYTPTTGYVGSTSFPYSVTTPTSTIVSAIDYIYINNIADDTKETPVNTAITYSPLINDTFPIGSTITKINGVTPVVGTPIPVPNGTATLTSTGTVIFTPTTGFAGTSTFPYSVTTPNGSVLTANDTITIVKAVDDTNTTPVNIPVIYSPMSNDAIPTGSTITKINGLTPVVGTPITISNGTVTLNTNGSVTVTPANNYTGTLTFPYNVTTPLGTSVSANDIVTITDTNPVAVDDTYSTLINTAKVITPLSLDTDIDNGAILSIISINGITLTPGIAQSIPVTNGTVTTSTTGVITFTPSTGYTGTVTFPYIISDGQGGTATANEIITILPLAVANNDSRSSNNSEITYNPIIDDTNIPSGSKITKINGIAVTAGSTIQLTGGSVTFNADGTVTVKSTSGGALSFDYTVTTPDGQIISAKSEVQFSNLVVQLSNLLRTGGFGENGSSYIAILMFIGGIFFAALAQEKRKSNQ
jgi:SdrD B-like domain/Bacterial Ig domain